MGTEFDNKEKRELTSFDIDSSHLVYAFVKINEQDSTVFSLDKDELKEKIAVTKVGELALGGAKITKWRIDHINTLIIGGF